MSLVITTDIEPFTVSDCSCEICSSYNQVNINWQKNRPTTRLQQRMQKVVYKLEKRYKSNRKSDVCIPTK